MGNEESVLQTQDALQPFWGCFSYFYVPPEGSIHTIINVLFLSFLKQSIARLYKLDMFSAAESRQASPQRPTSETLVASDDVLVGISVCQHRQLTNRSAFFGY